MGLIDADKLKREIHCSYSDDLGIIDVINNQPTAYDVDKVVERLKELNKYNLDLANRMLDIQSNGLDRHYICLEDAIKIVKAGGIDE